MRKFVTALVAGLALISMTACTADALDSAPAKKRPGVAGKPGKPVKPGEAVKALNSLEVKGRGPKTGYTREAFGSAWADVDGNRCDTRNDILARDLTNITYLSGSKCFVGSGTLDDPYTGKTINFVRGVQTSMAVQIDHVVALSDAWQKNAARWSPEKRKAFANDPLNLLASDGPANMSKGDGDAATWLPANKSFRCRYVARQIAVKKKYGVSVTEAEKTAMGSVLSNCPDVRLPSGGLANVPN